MAVNGIDAHIGRLRKLAIKYMKPCQLALGVEGDQDGLTVISYPNPVDSKCRLRPTSMGDTDSARFQQDREMNRTFYRVSFPWGTEVTEKHRVFQRNQIIDIRQVMDQTYAYEVLTIGVEIK